MRSRVNASAAQTEITRVTDGRSAVFSCPPIEEYILDRRHVLSGTGAAAMPSV
jgi:hypothetical protein